MRGGPDPYSNKGTADGGGYEGITTVLHYLLSLYLSPTCPYRGFRLPLFYTLL